MFGKADFSGLSLNINAGFIHLNLKYGAFLTDVINFIIMAFIIFLIVKFMNKIIRKKETKDKKEVDEKLEILKEIRDSLKEKSSK